MTKKIIQITCVLFILLSANYSVAQVNNENSKIKTDFSADLVSRYIWRGLQFGGRSPAIQPSVNFSYKNLSLGFWGSYSLGGVNSSQEFDISLSYSFSQEMFTATLTDYYFPDSEVNYNYFDYVDKTTGHVLEAMLSFNGTKQIPLTFLVAMNFYGADARKVNNDPQSPDFNQTGGIQYSNYFELGYQTKISGDKELQFFGGFTLTNPKGPNLQTGYIGEGAFYGGGSGIINLGCKISGNLNLTQKYSIPIYSSIITNPRDKKVYLVFGMTF
ncbi:MAG: hypothetical protein JXR65_12140 [Bacteroidales bacterium]|nr:hypothetical protein [Bacteroidales bacterium]